MSLAFVLHAKNSSGHQMLFINRDSGEINLTLCGEHEGKDIQVDFNSISEEDLADLIQFLSRRLKEPEPDVSILDAHWVVKNSGNADQYRREARAARDAHRKQQERNYE